MNLQVGESGASRVSAALKASARQLLGAGPKFGVVFHHIPKCAGVSVAGALSSVYPPWTRRTIEARASVAAVRFFDLGGDLGRSFDVSSEGWALIHEYRQRLLFTYLHAGAKAVSGHVVYNPRIHDAFEGTHRFVTVLRDPLDRFVSQYLYSSRSQSYDRIEASWDPEGLSKLGPIWGRTMTVFLGSASDNRRHVLSVEQMIENAKRAVDRLDVVGFTDRLYQFEGELAQQVGVKISVGLRNRSPAHQNKKIALSRLRPLIEEFCAPDIEVYSYARTKFAT